MARLSVKSSMKTQSIKLNYKSHKRDFIKTSTVCFAFSAHQEVILIQIEFYLNMYLNMNHYKNRILFEYESPPDEPKRRNRQLRF